jgi:hypothetical protein
LLNKEVALPVSAKNLPPLNDLFELLIYNPETGKFFWRKPPNKKIAAGAKAGTAHAAGYVNIGIKKSKYLAHRVAWVMSGQMLSNDDQIDHINGNRSDNRIDNLRLSSHDQNCMNSKARRHNFSKIKGAHFDKRRKKFRARIRVGKNEIWLGYFATAEEAHAAYCRAAKELHGPYARTE